MRLRLTVVGGGTVVCFFPVGYPSPSEPAVGLSYVRSQERPLFSSDGWCYRNPSPHEKGRAASYSKRPRVSVGLSQQRPTKKAGLAKCAYNFLKATPSISTEYYNNQKYGKERSYFIKPLRQKNNGQERFFEKAKALQKPEGLFQTPLAQALLKPEGLFQTPQGQGQGLGLFLAQGR
uniref:Uncharacterized protein n=1 Tax=Caulerpa lentillifera TaxID=148947 RepID=A0A2Z2QKM7_9CHLO|nr:hypothetical protein [Caulerpa lentillifera]AST24229.1 hypothetical protein [Caulerpa lentillifera]